MEKNKGNFSTEDLKKLAQSDAGKRLMSMLGTDTAAAVRESAARGDLRQAQQALSTFLSDPRAKALLQQLQEQSNG